MKVFISYRRADTAAETGRISDHLASHFGGENIFKDIDSISAGSNFLDVVREALVACDVVVAVIGPEWTRVTDASGQRRIDGPSDFVRSEIETALQRGLPVVPVLVSGATLPGPDALPTSLRDLAFRNGLEVRPDPDFLRDIDRLIRGLEQIGGQTTSDRQSGQRAIPDLDLAALSSAIVFVSHSTLDRDWVEAQVVTTLHLEGIRTWYSKTAIKTSAQWEREILRGLKSCDWFLLVASNQSARSEWVRDEVNWAVYRRSDRIVTVIMDDCDLYDFHIRIPRLQHIDFRHDVSEARSQLLDVFRSVEQSAAADRPREHGSSSQNVKPA